MLLNKTYEKAYAEILEIIKYLPSKEYNKIPRENIDFFENNKDNTHIFQYNPTKTLSEQNVLRETNALIISMFKDLFATKQQKEKIDGILQKNEENYQKNLKNKYGYEDMFKKKTTSIEEENSTQIMGYKESFLKKIMYFIRKILKKS